MKTLFVLFLVLFSFDSIACEDLHEKLQTYQVKQYQCNSTFANYCANQNYKTIDIAYFCNGKEIFVYVDFKNGTPLVELSNKTWQRGNLYMKQDVVFKNGVFISHFYRKTKVKEQYEKRSTWLLAPEKLNLRYDSRDLKETFQLEPL